MYIIILFILFLKVGFSEVQKPEPTLDEAQKAAIKNIENIIKDYPKILKNTKIKHLLPELKFNLDKNLNRDVTISTSGGAIDTNVGSDNKYSYGVSLSWDLKGLIFSQDYLRAISSLEDLTIFKLELLSKVSKLYFKRKKLQEDLKIEELKETTAELNNLTDGLYKNFINEK